MIKSIWWVYYIIIIINFLTTDYIYYEKPRVSIFLPIYNKELYLRRSISSIQKQTLKNLEIVAVNDYSTDNTLKILKKFAKKDERIKIVNNDRNHGLLYSRAMGILNCTGEYVLNLDPDDMLSNIFNLEILYKKAKNYKIDLIIFKLKKIKISKINNSQLNKIIKELNLIKSNSPMKILNNIITNKFIKRKIILKAYDSFKNKIYENKWNYHEDNIWSKLVSKYAKSKILLNKFMYLYLLNTESLMNNRGNIFELKNKIYKLEMIQIIYKNNVFTIFNNLIILLNKYKNIIEINFEIRKKFIHIFIKFLIFCKIKQSQYLKYIIIKILKNSILNISNKSYTFKKIY